VQEELVRQAQRGDAEAFDSLARTVGDRCLAIAVRILRDIDLAEDAVQTALIMAWTEVRALRDPSHLTGAWSGDDGGVSYIRQVGECVWWFGTELVTLNLVRLGNPGLRMSPAGAWSVPRSMWNGLTCRLATSWAAAASHSSTARRTTSS
jgi:hypothetical protein